MQGQSPSYVITKLVTPPVSYQLTTLANVKDELGELVKDTSNDARITRWINEESANIARYCNRVFGVATWQDEFRPQHGVWGEGVRAALNPLTLTKWPLAVNAVSFTGDTHSSLLVDGIASTAGLLSGMPIYGSGITSGTTIAQVMPTSILLSQVATATATGVSLNAGLSVVETVAGVDTQLVPGTDFEVDIGSLLPGDEGNGRIFRLNEQGNPRTWPAAKITVLYQAGYSLPNDASPNIPSDLESACIRIIVGRFQAKGRDPMLVEQTQPQSLGTQRFWVGATPGQTGPYPNEIMAILDRYRVPVIG